MGIGFISSTLDPILDEKIYHVSDACMSCRMGVDPTWEGGYMYWMVCCKLWMQPLSLDFWVYYLGLCWVLESWEENFNWEFTIKTDFLLFIEVVFFWLFLGFLRWTSMESEFMVNLCFSELKKEKKKNLGSFVVVRGWNSCCEVWFPFCIFLPLLPLIVQLEFQALLSEDMKLFPLYQ